MSKQFFINTLLGAGTLLLLSCSASKPQTHLIINNESNQSIPIDVMIRDNREGELKKNIRQLANPGLQQISVGRLKRGSYTIELNVNNGSIQKNYPLALDTDRWIMTTYMCGDSSQLQKKYGYVDASKMKKLNGQYTGIELYIENRRPPNL